MEKVKPAELLAKLESYYVPADAGRLTCIDERPCNLASDVIKVVGATDGVLDAFKKVTGEDEIEARAAYENSHLPFGGHLDNHRGVLGCGYRDKVNSEPSAVGAPEAISAYQRYAWISEHPQAFTPEYRGEHQPVAAVVNWRKNSTLNQSFAYLNKLGAFNLDAWHLREMAEKLHVDPQKFEEAMLTLFKKTIEALAPGTLILERR